MNTLNVTSRAATYHGMLQILCFNWNRYVQGLAAIPIAVAAIALLPLPMWAVACMVAGATLAGAWLVTSLLVSHIVYDRSRLCRWDWIRASLDHEPKNWINIHAGFDEASDALSRLFHNASGLALDIYDPIEMNEPSIRRARLHSRSGIAPLRADFRRLPVQSGSADLVTLLLAAHEIRGAEARNAFFGEVARIVAPGGRVVVAEHLRDLPNFFAFGPGFLHFHSRRTWLRAADHARLALEREFPITPFVRVFIFTRRPL